MSTTEAVVTAITVVSFFIFMTVLMVTAIKNPTPPRPKRTVPAPMTWTSETRPVRKEDKGPPS